MHTVDLYNFPLHPETHLDLFPPERLVGIYYAFHGTSEIYCCDIETKGFQRKWSPCKLEKFNLLIWYLEKVGLPDIESSEKTLVKRLQGYIDRRETSPLCFTYTGYESLFYATDLRKGGQIFKAINEAIKYIESHRVKLNLLQLFLFKFQFFKLKRRIKKLKNSRGCIYLVRFDENDLNFLEDNGAINPYSKGKFRCLHSHLDNIPPNNIIAKMYIGAEEKENGEIYMSAINSSRQKMSTPGYLSHRILSDRYRM